MSTTQDGIALAAERAFASPDPWLRSRACLVAIDSDRQLEHTIAALGDEAEMVRSAALEALERTPNLEHRLAMIEPTAGPLAKRMIAAWLRNEQAAQAPSTIEPATVPSHVTASVEQRAFGRLPFTVAPLCISGAFDPTGEALALAADAGVNLWFWEPAYDNLTKHLRERGGHVVTGSYHADAPSIEADVDRALKRLRRTHLDALLLFWARSSARVDAQAYAAIEHLKRSGKVRALGFSTHHRELARDAITQSPWDVVMIRHSAAHPGIETELLPTARERNTAILTFSALSYGRMLQGPLAPTAAQAYQYSMQQAGVTATISAPRRRSEVRENITALTAPALTDEQLQALRDHGRGVRAENQRFNALLRQPTRDAAAAARELLAAEMPPSDEVAQRPLPRPSDARSAKTNLGSRTSKSRRR
ncbi:MAG: aldo/keto reductase [Kofleriaceae bacterium]